MDKLTKFAEKCQSAVSSFKGTIGQTIALSVVVNIIVELLSRRSLIKLFTFMTTNILTFSYNTIIIFATLSIAFIFRHRIFYLLLISVLWIIIGVTDFILLCSRTTPFTAVDITLLKSTITIIPHYLNTFHYILAAVLIPLIIFLFIKLYKKAPLAAPVVPRIKAAVFTLLLALSCVGLTHIGVYAGMLSENFGNLANAYHDYGLAYCFVNSIINTGIDKPKKYSKEIVETIIDSSNKDIVLSSKDISPEADKNDKTNNNENNSNENHSNGFDKDNLDKDNDKDSENDKDNLGNNSSGESKDDKNTEKMVYNTASKESPNIIMLQLESFFDPMTIIGAEFNTDPIPNFRSIMKEYSSGFVNVPSVGAGTANTEFEMITGMNLDFFGPGEYPYKTILQKTTCESVSFNLGTLGYTTHAIHNNDGTFYDRNLIFSQLGFDTFTSIEYMDKVENNPNGWCRDYLLTNEIRKALESTPNQDFIYAISVQGHGAYPTEPLLENPKITLTLPLEYSESVLNGLNYYVNQINEMDMFVGELISYLKQCGEETVLVMYGDHLPGFGFTEEQLSNGTLFQTNYCIWSNFDLEKQDKDLEAYQMYSYIFERLGLEAGIIPKFHHTQINSEVYLEQLKILEYDMLYGELDCYGGKNPFEPTELKMGIDDITIFSYRVTQNEDKKTYHIAIIGNNFNEYSNVCINGEPVDSTTYQSRNLLIVESKKLEDKDIITVSQIGKDGKILSTTSELVFDVDEVKEKIK